MSKFTERCKVVYLGQDGELNWLTIIVDSAVTGATFGVIWYFLAN